MTQPQTLTHDLATQIEVAVLEPDFLAHLLVELEGQRLRAVEELQLTRQQLHAPGRKIGVHRSGRPLAHPSLDSDHELIAQPLGLAENLRRIGIEDDLQQALAIAQIDEDDPAMITPAVHPAGHLDRLADQLLIDLSAVVGAHRAGDVTGRPEGPQPEPPRP